MENKKTKLTVSGKIKKTINDFEASRSQKKKTSQTKQPVITNELVFNPYNSKNRLISKEEGSFPSAIVTRITNTNSFIWTNIS